jgi:heat shock protein HslJ
MKQIFAITALFIVFTSFRSDTTVKVDLYNSKWQLKTIHSREGAAYIYTNAFIRFDETQKRVSGNGSCNSFGGSVTINDNSLQIGNLFSTKMYCESVQSIEADFFAALGKVTRYEIKGNSLLMYMGDMLSLEFEVSQ